MEDETQKYPDNHEVILRLTLAEAREIADSLCYLYPQGPYGNDSQDEDIVLLRKKLDDILEAHGEKRQFI